MSSSAIHGNPKRGIGILNNQLYIGRLVWNPFGDDVRDDLFGSGLPGAVEPGEPTGDGLILPDHLDLAQPLL